MRTKEIKGIDGSIIAVDGDFGKQTEAGVETLQKMLGLEQTGRVDKPTWVAALKQLD
jgi:peptidoglycan hydrolase-like protein with peptidoglycan-binding domain